MKPSRRYTASLSDRIERAHRLRRATATFVVTLLTSALCIPVFAQTDTAAAEPAIPPGQEDVLLDILGHGAPLPDCELSDGQVKYTLIKVTYSCSNGDIEYQLTHRSNQAPGTTLTDQFAIKLTKGTPPGGFEDALVAHVRSNEDEFEWVWPGDDSPQ